MVLLEVIPFSPLKKLSTYLLVVAMAALSVSCKKDGENKPAASKADLLTAKNWRITADVTVSTTNGKTTTTDDFATAATCEKDNYFKFNTDKTVRFDEGANRCQGSNQTETGVWDFNSDQTKLTMGAAGSSTIGQFDIVELSTTTLKLSLTNSYGGTTDVETLTMTAF
jgi:hypothetical protein